MTKAASIMLIGTPVSGTLGAQSRPRNRPLSTILAAFLLLSLVACNDDDNNNPAPSPPTTGPNNPAPPAPGTTGTIQINTATSGGAPDVDGYSIVVDGATGQSVGANATIVIANVAPGSRSVNLTGEANNCMASSNPRSVTVTAGATTPITFDVSCRTNAEILSARPLAPTDRSLFVPEAYPDTPPLVPAQGAPLTEQQAQQALQDYLKVDFPNDVNAQNAALAIFNNPIALQKIPNPSLRAGLAALMGTIGEPAIDFILNATTLGGLPKVQVVRFANPNQLQDGAIAEIFHNNQTGQLTSLFNAKYEAENPFLFSNTLAHEPLHQDAQNADFEEININALDQVVYLDQLSRHSELAQTGTELARRHNARALTRLNSGIGSSLGLFQANGNNPILPGSTDPITNWFAQFNITNPAPTPGSPLFTDMLKLLVNNEVAVPADINFSRETLDFIDQNTRTLTEDQLVAAAKALKLDIR